MAHYSKTPWSFKGSKAPWSLKGNKVVASDGTEVARVMGRQAKDGPKSVSEASANAQLLCMAPRLAQAIRLALKHLEAGKHKGIVAKVLQKSLRALGA